MLKSIMVEDFMLTENDLVVEIIQISDEYGTDD
jgi:hypothetical protein